MEKTCKFIQKTDNYNIATYVFYAYDPNICLYLGYQFPDIEFKTENLREIDLSEFCENDYPCFEALRFTNKSLSNQELNTCISETETSKISNETLCTEMFNVDCK